MHIRRLCLTALLLSLTLTAYAAPTVIHYRHASGKWLALPCTVDDARGVISFTLDPKVIGGGSTTVLLGEQKGIMLDDEQPPRVTGIKLDGQGVRVGPVVDLDWLAETPRTLVIGLADTCNALDLSSLRLQVNGKALEPEQVEREPSRGGKSLRLTVPLADLLAGDDRFLNVIELRASDVAPLQNTVSLRLQYRHLGEVTQSPTLLVDSFYKGYEDLKVLTDGKVMKAGETTYGCTWASEEEPGDHWLVFAWPQEECLSVLEVFWATFQGTYHAPRKLLVQTWDGKRWETQQTLTDLKAEASTEIEFTPVHSTRLRLLQPDGEGNPVRPNIMWITEVKAP
ncbi:MAG: hypothetical protein KKI08_22670 [Armatimonadetes bacterium]|nr:hypothetical protein [Armatimonadota bacterium]